MLNKIRFKKKLIVISTCIHNTAILQLKAAFVGKTMKQGEEKPEDPVGRL